MTNRIIKVSRSEFELEDGRTFPIIPPLEEDLTAEEFQEHYDRAYKLIGSISPPESQPKDTETLGQGRQDKDYKDGWRTS